MNPRTARRAGLSISAVTAVLLLADAVTHVVRIPPVRTAMADLGFDQNAAVVVGVLEIACLVLYLTPRTAVLGVVLFTAYFGGALCANFRVDKPLWSTVLFPVYVAIGLWAGLWLRDERLRAILPLRREAATAEAAQRPPSLEHAPAEAMS
jgi:DoxX-like protein